MALLREGMISTLADCGMNKNRWFWSLISSFDFLPIKAKTEQDRLKSVRITKLFTLITVVKEANWHFLERFLDRMVNTTHWMFQSDGSPEGCVRDKPQEMNGRKFQTLPPQDQSTRVSPADLNASKLCNLVPGFHYESQNCQVIETDMRSKQKTRTSTRRSGIGWHNFRSFCPTDSCAPICFRSRANLRKWAHLYLDSLLTYSTIVSVIHVPALCVIPRTVPATVLETWATTSTVVWNGRHDFANTLQVPMCPCERTHIGQTLLCQRHK